MDKTNEMNKIKYYMTKISHYHAKIHAIINEPNTHSEETTKNGELTNMSQHEICHIYEYDGYSSSYDSDNEVKNNVYDDHDNDDNDHDNDFWSSEIDKLVDEYDNEDVGISYSPNLLNILGKEHQANVVNHNSDTSWTPPQHPGLDNSDPLI
jgi:hypothetical protein